MRTAYMLPRDAALVQRARFAPRNGKKFSCGRIRWMGDSRALPHFTTSVTHDSGDRRYVSNARCPSFLQTDWASQPLGKVGSV